MKFRPVGWMQLLAFQIIIINLTGCSDRYAKPILNEHESLKSYSDAELTQLLVPGKTKSQIKLQFGEPLSTWERDGIEVWTYVFEFNENDEKNVVRTSGFQANFKSDKLLRWTPVLEVNK